MKKVLFVFLMMILVPIVQAEERVISCSNSVNLLDKVWHYGNFGQSSDSPSKFLSNDMFVPVEPGDTITVSSNFDLVHAVIYPYNSNFYSYLNFRVPDISVESDIYYSSYLVPDGIYYLRFMFFSKGVTINAYNLTPEAFEDGSKWIQIEKGGSFSEYVLYNDCSSIPINPVKPDEPIKPSETDEGKILTNFYTLFIDKVKFICNYATNSPLFLAFIGIFILFFVLKMFLYLFNKGGYRV